MKRAAAILVFLYAFNHFITGSFKARENVSILGKYAEELCALLIIKLGVFCVVADFLLELVD